MYRAWRGGGGDREKDGGRDGLLWRRGSSRGDGWGGKLSRTVGGIFPELTVPRRTATGCLLSDGDTVGPSRQDGLTCWVTVWDRRAYTPGRRVIWKGEGSSCSQGCLNESPPSPGPGIPGGVPAASRPRAVWEPICPEWLGVRLRSELAFCKKGPVRGQRPLSAGCQGMEFDFKVIRQRLSGNTTAALKWKSRFQRLTGFRCDNVVLWA